MRNTVCVSAWVEFLNAGTSFIADVAGDELAAGETAPT
jgi:hypothetical protein